MNRILNTITILLIAISIHAQATYTLTCNQNTNKLEILRPDQINDYHKVIKDNFPNFLAAQNWQQANYTSWDCDSNEEAPPPPPANNNNNNNNTGNVPNTTSPNPPSVQPQPKTSNVYPRGIAIKGVGSYAAGIDDYLFSYGGTRIGYGVEAEIFFGSNAKFGLGFGYFSLYEDDIYARWTFYKARGLVKIPFQVRQKNWLLIMFNFDYHFESFDFESEPATAFGFGAGLEYDLNHLLFGFNISGHGYDYYEYAEKPLILIQAYAGIAF